MSQINVKLSRCVTQCGKVSTGTSSTLQRLQIDLAFFWYPDAGFRLIFFRKVFLKKLPHKLTSDLFMVDVCC